MSEMVQNFMLPSVDCWCHGNSTQSGKKPASHITPTAGIVVDRTFYQLTLRPGVMVEFCSRRESTSGIPLLRSDG